MRRGRETIEIWEASAIKHFQNGVKLLREIGASPGKSSFIIHHGGTHAYECEQLWFKTPFVW